MRPLLFGKLVLDSRHGVLVLAMEPQQELTSGGLNCEMRNDRGKVENHHHNPLQTGGYDQGQQDDAGQSKATNQRREKSEPSEEQGNSEKVTY